MAYKRKTRDVWRFYVNYGAGWEHEHTDVTRAEMKENRKQYRENCAYPVRIKRVRERIEPDSALACEFCEYTASDDESLRKHYDWHNEQNDQKESEAK